MPFFTIRQSNSGGVWDCCPALGIGEVICVEAGDPEEAEERLETIVRSYDASPDCACCGARWCVSSACFEHDERGTTKPVYLSMELRPTEVVEPGMAWAALPSYLHTAQGTIIEVTCEALGYANSCDVRWVDAPTPKTGPRRLCDRPCSCAATGHWCSHPDGLGHEGPCWFECAPASPPSLGA